MTVKIRIETAAGSIASRVGDRYTQHAGDSVNAVDRCDADGCGRVFLEFPTAEDADAAMAAADDDDDVVSYQTVA